MPARHRHHHSSEPKKLITITMESCSRSLAIRVHVALETAFRVDRNLHDFSIYLAAAVFTATLFWIGVEEPPTRLSRRVGARVATLDARVPAA
jgi:hypothetical protein